MAPADQERLRELVRREGRSLLRYVRDAEPWVPAKDRGALEQVRAMSAAETAALDDLTTRLVRRRVTLPSTFGFPTAFTSLNFLALSALLPRLVEAQRRGVAALSEDEAALADDEMRGRVTELRAQKERHLGGLKSL
jgi:hypothetical protein